jgi:hypothetical protein
MYYLLLKAINSSEERKERTSKPIEDYRESFNICTSPTSHAPPRLFNNTILWQILSGEISHRCDKM